MGSNNGMTIKWNICVTNTRKIQKFNNDSEKINSLEPWITNYE